MLKFFTIERLINISEISIKKGCLSCLDTILNPIHEPSPVFVFVFELFKKIDNENLFSSTAARVDYKINIFVNIFKNYAVTLNCILPNLVYFTYLDPKFSLLYKHGSQIYFTAFTRLPSLVDCIYLVAGSKSLYSAPT